MLLKFVTETCALLGSKRSYKIYVDDEGNEISTQGPRQPKLKKKEIKRLRRFLFRNTQEMG